jgi:hypothetical protein
MFVTRLNTKTYFFNGILTVLGGVAPPIGRAADADEGSKPKVAALTVIGGEEDGTSVKVRYHDLNLTTDAGVTAWTLRSMRPMLSSVTRGWRMCFEMTPAQKAVVERPLLLIQSRPPR